MVEHLLSKGRTLGSIPSTKKGKWKKAGREGEKGKRRRELSEKRKQAKLWDDPSVPTVG